MTTIPLLCKRSHWCNLQDFITCVKVDCARGGFMNKLFIKRVLYFSTAVLLVSFLFVVLHNKFQTKTDALAPRSVDQVFQEKININDLSEYLKTQNDDLVLLVKDDNQDSDYLITSVLSPLANEQVEQALPDIVKINVPEGSDLSVTRLKNLLEIETYPAFVYISCEGDGYQIKDTKVYDPHKPFTSDELKTWFFDNNLWQGPYGVR